MGLRRVVIAARDPEGTARLFQRLFALSEQSTSGGPRILLSVGRGTVLVLPADDAGGVEGMAALSMVTGDLDAVGARLRATGAAMLSGAGELTIEPGSSHGVHLHLSRYD